MKTVYMGKQYLIPRKYIAIRYTSIDPDLTRFAVFYWGHLWPGMP